MKRFIPSLVTAVLLLSNFIWLGPRVSAVSTEDARKIFLCDRSTWPGGKHITVLMFAPGHPARSIVLREIYKMSETDYSRYFLEAVFTGRLQGPPREVTSAAQMKRYLAANQWAIGYLKKEDVDDSVKVVLRSR